MTTEILIWLIPLPPILAFFLIVLFTNRSKAAQPHGGDRSGTALLVGAMLVFVRAVGAHELGKEPSLPPSTGSRRLIRG